MLRSLSQLGLIACLWLAPGLPIATSEGQELACLA